MNYESYSQFLGKDLYSLSAATKKKKDRFMVFSKTEAIKMGSTCRGLSLSAFSQFSLVLNKVTS